MKKKIAIYSIFFILMALLISGLDRMFSIKTAHGIKQAKAMYQQPKDSMDIVFMGSSHIHCNINTAYLWENYGIAAYDYSAAEQTLWETYYYLKELCKYQSPKVIVLDMYSPARFKDDYQYEYMVDNLQGLRPSFNKLIMLGVSVERSRWTDYCPDFISYHNRYEELEDEDYAAFWKEEDLTAFKGYTPYFDVRPQGRQELLETESTPLSDKSSEYLTRIIDLAQGKGIELYFMVTPYTITDEDERAYNYISEFAESKGIVFDNTNYDYDEIGLDFDQDFNDDSHLNYWGSCKFTEYLSKKLLDMYGEKLPDHRGDSEYGSWDENVLQIQEEVKANQQ